MRPRAASFRVERLPRRRGTFGLDDRRRPDPARVEAEIRGFLAARLPDLLVLSVPAEPAGRTLVLLQPGGHAAVLRLAPDTTGPAPPGRAVLDRCRALRIPNATASTFDEARAALRRFGIEPRPLGPSTLIPFARSARRCRESQKP